MALPAWVYLQWKWPGKKNQTKEETTNKYLLVDSEICGNV